MAVSGRLAALLGMAVLATLTACGGLPTRGPSAPGAPVANAVPIMGASRLTPQQLAAWFSRRTPRPPGSYAATAPLETLTWLFIEEGAAERVAGDVAFVQSVLETGWFRFTGNVPASSNNFAGIGAVGPVSARAHFPDPRTGVRAQIQHLRAYADPTAATCSVPPLHYLCADPRFDLVLPKGRAPVWNQMGNGNWAADPGYGTRILSLYAEALAFSGVAPAGVAVAVR